MSVQVHLHQQAHQLGRFVYIQTVVFGRADNVFGQGAITFGHHARSAVAFIVGDGYRAGAAIVKRMRAGLHAWSPLISWGTFKLVCSLASSPRPGDRKSTRLNSSHSCASRM